MLKGKGKIRFLGLILMLVCLVQPVSAQAVSYAPYATYTYSLDQEHFYAYSPHAYVPTRLITSAEIGLGTAMKTPSDLAVDKDGNVYIADTGNNRVIVLDSEYKLRFILNGLEDGVPTDIVEGDEEEEAPAETPAEGGEGEGEGEGGGFVSMKSFSEPKAVFATPEGDIYVGDTMHGRIVVFNSEGILQNTYNSPEEELLQDVIYEPSALVVDQYDRIYVISQNSNMGVLSFSSDGQFQGFIGAEKTKGSFWDIVMNFFRSDEQKARMMQNVPTEFNNITIDDKGFLYVTTSTLDSFDQYESMVSKTGTANPIKKLNPSGTDVLKRNGAFNQGGDLYYFRDNVSRFIDVALAEDGVYSLLDSTDGKIFTYDVEGNLMYVFGGSGTQMGVFQRPSAIAYKGTDLLALDSSTGELTIFSRTEYGDVFAEALHLQGNRKYTEAAEKWKELIKLNGNYEQAYNNIGTSYMRLGMYEEAMVNYKNGNDLDGYKDAYNSYRKGIMEKYILLFLVAAAVIVFLIAKGTKKLKAANDAAWTKHGKYTLREELCYGWYVIFHPFDGFYELKRERRGTMKGALVIFTAAIAENLFRSMATGYIVTGSEFARVSIVDAFMSVGFLVILWSVANWCFTTLMDGKGRMKDIFIASSYALIPMIMFGFPCTIVTNFCTESELQFVNFFYSLGNIWTFALIFLGALVINEYSLLKNVATTFLALVGMAFIAFIGILGVNLFTTMFGFIQTIANEIIYRM